MGYGFKVELFGDYALFSRPEFKVERVSYDIITPSAARGILEAIYWKPAIHYVIDKIHVINEPKFKNIRRNEVSAKILASDMKKLMSGIEVSRAYINTKDTIQQRASMILTNVRYVIEAHFEMTKKAGEEDTPEKHYNILLRRLRKGQMFYQPYFGCREFPANFRIIEDDEIPKSNIVGERDLGFMLYDMNFSESENITPMFFRAYWKNGVVDLTDVDIVR
ncbi:type I-C CRISPR-associated protein Cas5c [Clostridium sp. Marseille-P299]|uniref:type I-C CRISPR-associated protein Cas5c n=1 Tax=Clostridium sp. Marseille-P299 TaxID=1805477 RepID=UPI00083067C5|nr:type I-C CRISPR-associated protein Cas5c [Clostridium sp. Marseille-P299]